MQGMKPKPPVRIKIISVGDTEVGKTCLIKRYYEKAFNSKYVPTTGVDYGFISDDRKANVSINMFDFSGDPLYLEIRNDFYKNTQGVLLVYDVTNRRSFKALEGWVSEMYQEMTSVEFMHLVVIVCANKTDKLYRAVEFKEGKRWADMHSYPYFETSAQNGTGVSEVFEKLLQLVVTNRRQVPIHMRIPRLFRCSDPCDTKGQDSEKNSRLTTGYAIQKLLNGLTEYDKLGLPPTASVDDVNKMYRRLAVLLHPDKSMEPGAADAFKILVAAKNNILRRLNHDYR